MTIYNHCCGLLLFFSFLIVVTYWMSATTCFGQKFHQKYFAVTWFSVFLPVQWLFIPAVVVYCCFCRPSLLLLPGWVQPLILITGSIGSTCLLYHITSSVEVGDIKWPFLVILYATSIYCIHLLSLYKSFKKKITNQQNRTNIWKFTQLELNQDFQSLVWFTYQWLYYTLYTLVLKFLPSGGPSIHMVQ